MKLHKNRKGFTLIELLVVIAIIAVLAGVVVLTLNPAERLAESRDSRRQQDLNTVRDAINIALTDGDITLTDNTTSPGHDQTGTTVVTGSGWVSFDGDLSSHIPVLPTDPQGDESPCGYFYASDGTNYELNTCFETDDYETERAAADGGDEAAVWEIGTDLTLMSSNTPTE